MTMPSSRTVSIDELRQFCLDVLTKLGADMEYAAVVADAMATTDSWGVFTHGSKLLAAYVRRIKAGGIRVDCLPTVIRSGPSWSIVDGCSVMGHVAGSFAMEQAIRQARQTGIAMVSVRQSNHFGAAGYFAWLAAREGLLGIAMANDIPSVAAPGSLKAVTGSNPLAYAIPTADGTDPILLDMAISTVAGGKVYAAHQRGESIPETWINGPDGMPTTDSSLYPAGASLQPMSGAKGYGIALLIESLSAIVSGAAIMWQVSSCVDGDLTVPTNHGASFIAIDVAQMQSREEYQRRVQYMIDEVHQAPTIRGVQRLMLPGEREWAHRHRALREGIVLPPDVVGQLATLGFA